MIILHDIQNVYAIQNLDHIIHFAFHHFENPHSHFTHIMCGIYEIQVNYQYFTFKNL